VEEEAREGPGSWEKKILRSVSCVTSDETLLKRGGGRTGGIIKKARKGDAQAIWPSVWELFKSLVKKAWRSRRGGIKTVGKNPISIEVKKTKKRDRESQNESVAVLGQRRGPSPPVGRPESRRSDLGVGEGADNVKSRGRGARLRSVGGRGGEKSEPHDGDQRAWNLNHPGKHSTGRCNQRNQNVSGKQRKNREEKKKEGGGKREIIRDQDGGNVKKPAVGVLTVEGKGSRQ